MPITDALNRHLKDRSLFRPAAYIGGRWLETAENGTTFEVTNPSTGEVLAVLPNCGVAEARLAIAAAIPTLVTVVLELAGIWHPSNVTRAVAGFPLGVMVALVVTSALATLHLDECVPRRPTVPKPPQ